MTDGSPEAGPNSTPLSTANIETIPEEQKRSPSSIRKTSVDRVPEQQRRSSSSIRKTSVNRVPEEQRRSFSSIRKISVNRVPEEQRHSSSSIRKTSVNRVPEKQRRFSSSIRKTSVDRVPERISANPHQPIPKQSVLSNPEEQLSQGIIGPMKETAASPRNSPASVTRFRSSSSPKLESPRLSRVSPLKMEFTRLPEPLVTSRVKSKRSSGSPFTKSGNNQYQSESGVDLKGKSSVHSVKKQRSFVKFGDTETKNVAKKPRGCAPKTNCSRLGECRSSPAKCGDAKGSCRRAKSCVQSAVSCAVCEVKRSCSAAKGRCLSKTNEASTSSAFICASCLAQSKSCQNVRSCTSGGKSCSKNDGNNVQGQTDGNGNRKCCRKKTNPNHQCKSKSGNNATIPSSTVEVDNAKRNSNLSRLLDLDDVRGQLTAVEQMLQDVKKNVIDKRKKQQQLSMSASMPEKIIRFEDETNMTTNNMKRFGIRRRDEHDDE